MGNNGKSLEKTINLIEDTYKDSKTTQVFRNHRIKDVNGTYREIDVLIKTYTNGYEMNIAIECKDYKGKVSASNIEAFHSKCSTIEGINKMIFVSTNGFQKTAINNAKLFKIQLMTAEELTTNTFALLPPVYSLTSEIAPQFSNVVFTFCEKSKKLSDSGEFKFDGLITNIDTKEKTNIYEIFCKCLNENYNRFKYMASLKWMQLDNKHSGLKKINIPCEILFEGFFIDNNKGEEIVLKKANFDITINLTSSLNTDVTGRIVKYDNDEIRASTIKIQLDEKTEGEIILKDNEEFETYLTTNENTTKLETLFTYNKETNTIAK